MKRTKWRLGLVLVGGIALVGVSSASAATLYAVAVQGPSSLDEPTRAAVENQLRAAVAAQGFSLVASTLVKQAAARVIIGRIDGEDNLIALGKAVRATHVLVAVLQRAGTGGSWQMRLTLFNVAEQERRQSERTVAATQAGATARTLATELVLGKKSAPPAPTPKPTPPPTPTPTPTPKPSTLPAPTPSGDKLPPPPVAPESGQHQGFVIGGFTTFGVQPGFSWMINAAPGYTWMGVLLSLKLGFAVADTTPGTRAAFLLGMEGRYYLLDGTVKPYPVLSVNGLLGSESFFLLTAGFGIQYDIDKNLGVYGEISPLSVLAGGGIGGNYYFHFGGGVQYRF